MGEYKFTKVPKDGSKITIGQYGNVVVPNNPIIPFIEGDGIGVDITPAMKIVIDGAVQKAYNGTKKIVWMEVFAGEKALKQTGEYLPAETLAAFKEFVVGIKGPMGTPTGGGIRSLNVALRQELDLYSCVRPVKWYGQGSPIKTPEKVDYIIWRENTDDIYIGVEWAANSNEVLKLINFLRNEMGVPAGKIPMDSSIGIKPTSEFKTKRHVRKALRNALYLGRKTATLMHKGNIQKFTEGYFMKWGYEVANEAEFRDVVITWDKLSKEFGGEMNKAREAGYKLLINDVIADNMFQQLLTKTGEYDVIISQNLNGDYISDEAAGLVGGLGLAPGSNIGDGYAIFEATHGTAPKYAGQDVINPGSLILSGMFMLEYMGWLEAAYLVEKGIKKAMEDKVGTYDIVREWKKENQTGTEMKTSEFAKAIVDRM